MAIFSAKTTYIHAFLNKNTMKGHWKKNSLGRLNFYTMVQIEGSCDHKYQKMGDFSFDPFPKSIIQFTRSAGLAWLKGQ